MKAEITAALGGMDERARVLLILNKWLSPDHIRLKAGELTASELRTALAVVRGIQAEVMG